MQTEQNRRMGLAVLIAAPFRRILFLKANSNAQAIAATSNSLEGARHIEPNEPGLHH
jgi:hypothetical protein